MKKLTTFILVFLMGLTGVIAQGPKKPKKNSVKPVMAYEAEYSSRFSLADDTYTAIVLDLWKDYEENNFVRNVDHFADDIVAELYSGEVVTGKENLLKGAKVARNGVTDFSTKMISYISLRSDDKDENWVAVWGEDSYKDKDGKSVTNAIHEIMRFNKDGKIDFMKQYAVNPGK